NAVQRQADQPADERAVDAYELQILADREFDFSADGLRIPFVNGLGDEVRHGVAAGGGSLFDDGAQQAVGLALDHFIFGEAVGEGVERFNQMRANARVGPRYVGRYLRTQVVPQALQVARDGRMREQFGFERLRAFVQFR